MFDMVKMMEKMKEVQTRVKETQNSLVTLRASGESGGGMVKATVNGDKKLVALDIAPDILGEKDKIPVQDLIIAATNKALDEMDVLVREKLQKSTEGLLPNIPGVDFSNFMR